MFLLVPARPGSPGQRAVKRLLCVCVCHVDVACGTVLSCGNSVESKAKVNPSESVVNGKAFL